MKYILIFFGVTACLLSGCKDAQEDSNTIAQADGFSISSADLDEHYSSKFFAQRFPKSELRAYPEALQSIIFDSLKLEDFFGRDLHKNAEVMSRIQRVITEELMYLYYEEAYVKRYVNEATIQGYYEAVRKELLVSQLAIQRDLNEPETQQLDDILSNIVADFKSSPASEIIDKYSGEVKFSNQSGSTLRISWQNKDTRPFFSQLYKLSIGEVAILKSATAFLVFKVTDIEETKIPEFDEVKNQLGEELKKTQAPQIYTEFLADKEKVIDESLFTWNESGLNMILQNKGLPTNDEVVLAVYPSGEITMNDYSCFFEKVLKPDNPSSMDMPRIKEFIIEALRVRVLAEKGKEMGLLKKLISPDTPSTVLRYHFVRLYDDVMLNKNIGEPTQEQLRKFYLDHKEDQFYQLAKVNILAKIYPDSSEAEKLVSTVQEGASFEEAANRRYKVFTYLKEKDGSLKPYLAPEAPTSLAAQAFKLNKGEISRVLSFVDASGKKQYAVFKCKERIPEKQLSFEEAGDINEKYLAVKKEEITEKIRKELMEKYNVRINRDKLKSKAAS